MGKLAVDAAVRGRGVARRIMQVVETLAHANARPFVELETRVELIENHETFAALGFSKVAESAHPGFDRVTSITMRKPVRTESLPADASELANVEFGSSGSPRQAHRMRSRGQPHLLQWGLTFEAVGWQSVTRLGGRPVRLDD